MATCSKSSKRKRKVLSVEQKLEICRRLRGGTSITALSKELELGKSTICDIKRNEGRLTRFAAKMDSTEGSMKRKTMKMASDTRLDDAVFLWFAQKRSQGVPVSGPILMAKALELNAKINPGDEKFKASTGWLKNFQSRHGIRQLAIQGETMRANKDAVGDFKSMLSQLIKDEGLVLGQVYNCDETDLYWKALPSRTLASRKEEKEPGYKDRKERVTILACANATGDHKLRLTMIGKAKNPRALKGLPINAFPLNYTHQKSAWMTSGIFQDWFFHEFIPATVEYLKAKKLPAKALLLMDNAPSHPSTELLQSKDGNIKCLFLPPNTTSLMQPMDQGVLESMKRRYRKELLRKLLLADSTASPEDDPELTVVDLWKKLNIKDVMFMITKAWNDIPQSTIQASWNKLLVNQDAEGSVEDPPVVHEILHTLESIHGCGDCDEANVREWIAMDSSDQGYELLDDDEIIRTVTDTVDEEQCDMEGDVQEMPIPSHGEVQEMLTKCLPWVEQQPETTATHLFIYKYLLEMAAAKRVSSLHQTMMTSFFSS